MYIEWDESYSVGVEKFDSQHKVLFDLLNTLMESVMAGTEESKKNVGEVLNSLFDYTVYHFTEEEQVLKQNGYPGSLVQETEHDFLTSRVKRFHTDYFSDKAPVTEDIVEFIKNWLIEHIQEKDKKYGTFLNEKGIK